MSSAQSREEQTPVGKWLSYRPQIKVLDATIRDGGLMNNHRFADDLVRVVYRTCVDAGIDYMEIGYKNSRKIFDPAEHGPWKFCAEEDIRRIVGDNDTPLKLSAMADAEKSDYQDDIISKEDSVLDLIRVATYIHQIPLALDMVQDAHEKGYETSLNLMAISTVQESELDAALALIADSAADTICVVDSFGALYSEEVEALVTKYLEHATPVGKEVSIHAHNNQQLAFANTVEALVQGANLLDASMAGLGRGAGNCPLELLLGFLHNPKFRLRPVLQCIQDHIEPLRQELVWGYDCNYMITGMLNQHPRAAIAFNQTQAKDQIVRFFDSMVEEE